MGECFPKNKESTANYPSTDDESLEPGRLLGGPPPIGRFMGGLSPLRAVDLGGQAIAAALTRSEVASSELDEVIFGHVLVGGDGQITALQAAVGLASRSVRLGEANFVMPGGMESMSNAPYMVRHLRSGLGMGDASMVDVMVHDGLFCAFDQCTMPKATPW